MGDDQKQIDVESEVIDVTPDLDGGVLKKIIKHGVGTICAPAGCTVTVDYTGKLIDGTVFDSSKQRDKFSFTLGNGMVIRAWDLGIATMKKGEIAEFTCKSEYAYGAAGSPPKIPPNATLIFEVEMHDWTGEDLSPKKDKSIIRTVLEVGEGFSSPNEFCDVEIHMVGEHNGKVFEDRSVSFTLGEGKLNGVCYGVEKALEKFKLKEKSKLEIKSQHAFGEDGKSEFNIPPNADVVYTVTLKSFTKVPNCYSLDDQEKLEYGKRFKEKGTAHFTAGRYELAIKFYERATDYVKSDVGFAGDENKLRKEIYIAIHLNLALCFLKTKSWNKAKDMCDKVLELDDKNEKAYFRKGQAYLELVEPEKAKDNFQKVVTLDGANALAQKNILKCNDIIKKNKEQEKKIYANMFEKFAKFDKEKEEADRKQEPDVMKTLGAWGEDERDREPTEFEKENPNILMLDSTGDFKNM